MKRAACAWLWLALLAAGCQSPARTGWIELFDGQSLDGFVSTDFGGQGQVHVVDHRLELGIGSPLTGVTWTGSPPHGTYELELVARRNSGTDFFCGLTFPVGDAHLTLVLGGWGGSIGGLSSLDGNDAFRNETRTLRHFDAGRDYTVLVRVEPTRVEATIDGEPFCAVITTGRELSLRSEVLLSRPLGLATFATSTSVARWRWRPAR